MPERRGPGQIDNLRGALHRWSHVATAAALAAGLALVGNPGASAAGASAASVTIGGLRMDNRADQPLGVDDPRPTFSWQLSGGGASARQLAYQVRATDASGVELWDSGRVAGQLQQATYAGSPLTSRTAVSWQVRVWDGNRDASPWSKPASFEMGLLQTSDWGAAKWIQVPPPPANRGVVIDVGDQSARYIRLDVTKLGLPLVEPTYGKVSRIQLAEMEVLAPDGTNVALGAGVSAYDQFQSQGWGTKQLTEGKIISPGYMSRQSATQDVNPSKWVQLDLRAVQHFDKIVLFPRSDSRTPDGQIPNFPVDFTIRTSETSSTPTNVIKTVTNEPNPQGP